MSSALWAELDDDGLRRAVLEHERAHLRHRHGLLLAVAELAVTINPLLAPSVPRLRFEIERWADEDAAAHTSRATVAEAVITVALGHRTIAAALGFDGATSSARASALLTVAGSRPACRRVVVLAALTVVVVVATVLACHDIELLFEALRQRHPTS